MIDVSPFQMETVTGILRKHVPDCEVRAFGSRATWTAKDYSDLDLAVVGKEKLSSKILFALKEDFQESNLPFRVDVLDWNSISKEFRKVIEKNYEVVQKIKGNKQTQISGIPEGWGIGKIGDLVNVRSGYAIKSSDFCDSGVGVIKIKNIDAGRVDLLDTDKVVSNFFETLSDEYKVSHGDILIAMTGATIGKTGKVRSTNDRFVLNQRVARFVANDPWDLEYVFQYTLSKEFINSIHNLATGAAQQNISAENIASIPILVPPKKERSYIAKILSDFDAKIELNHQMNKTLEQIAQAIFKQWFVDFKFPGHEKAKFVNGLPEGWQEVPLTDVVDVLGGGTPSTTEPSYWGNELPFFTPKDASENCYVIETEKSISLKGLENCNSQKYPRNTVFITARGTVGKVCMAGCDMAMNQSCYAIRSKNDSGQQYYIYHLIKGLADQLIQNAHGTVFETITTETFRKTKVIQPLQNILDAFAAQVEPFYDLILSNIQETRKLEEIRDTLLPKLMSGEIRA